MVGTCKGTGHRGELGRLRKSYGRGRKGSGSSRGKMIGRGQRSRTVCGNTLENGRRQRRGRGTGKEKGNENGRGEGTGLRQRRDYEGMKVLQQHWEQMQDVTRIMDHG